MEDVNRYYVYFHMKEGKVVYVGKGTDARAWSNKRTSPEHCDWVFNCQHSGLNFVHIAKSNLSQDEAYKFEEQMIDEHGPIWNFTHEKCELCDVVYKNKSAHYRFNHIGIPYN